jgi:hypothetical protein
MSVFIAGLALDSVLLNAAKMSILVASFLAGAGGFMLLRQTKSMGSTERTETRQTGIPDIQVEEPGYDRTNES